MEKVRQTVVIYFRVHDTEERFTKIIETPIIPVGKNLEIDDKVVINHFNHGVNIGINKIEYNNVDVTDYGKEFFEIPEDHTSHAYKISIT